MKKIGFVITDLHNLGHHSKELIYLFLRIIDTEADAHHTGGFYVGAACK